MASLGGFNAREVDPSVGGGNWEPIPDGTLVIMQMISEEVKPNSKNSGDLLAYEAEVIEGEYQGRTIKGTINLSHSNPVAQKIGQEELSALCHAMGELDISDTEQLLWKPFRAVIKVETYTKRDGGEGLSNRIAKFVWNDDQIPQPPETKQAAAPAARTSPSTARSTGNGGSAPTRPSAGGAARDLPWKRSA